MAGRNDLFKCPRAEGSDLNCWMNLVRPAGVVPAVLPFPNLSSECFACDYFSQNVARSKGRREADQLALSSLKLVLKQLRFFETELKSTTSNLSKRVEDLAILKKVSDGLLVATDLETSLRLILTGAIAGQAIGFNRAFVFLVNEKRSALEGKMGVGPADAREAEMIWSALKRKGVGFDQMVKDILDGKALLPNKLSGVIRDVILPLDLNLSLLSKAILERKTFNASSSQLGEVEKERLSAVLSPQGFAVVPIVTERGALGVMVADNLFTGEPVLDEDVAALETFANEAAVQIENLLLRNELLLKLREVGHTHNLPKDNQNHPLSHEHWADIGKVATTLAHEIKTPLIAIGGYARRALKNAKGQKLDPHDLKIVVSEVERLERLTSQILDYSKETKLSLSKQDLNRIIKETLEVFEERLKVENIQLKTEFSDKIRQIKLDPPRIKQVLFNLIGNAIEAMPQGGSLAITTRRRKKGVELEIEDTGKGIPNKEIRRLFVPFYSSKPEGSGLGLPVSKKIVASHKGTIEVQSQLNVGTKFTVFLPLSN
jgi:signal transduction histidine kinase